MKQNKLEIEENIQLFSKLIGKNLSFGEEKMITTWVNKPEMSISHSICWLDKIKYELLTAEALKK